MYKTQVVQIQVSQIYSTPLNPQGSGLSSSLQAAGLVKSSRPHQPNAIYIITQQTADATQQLELRTQPTAHPTHYPPIFYQYYIKYISIYYQISRQYYISISEDTVQCPLTSLNSHCTQKLEQRGRRGRDSRGQFTRHTPHITQCPPTNAHYREEGEDNSHATRHTSPSVHRPQTYSPNQKNGNSYFVVILVCSEFLFGGKNIFLHVRRARNSKYLIAHVSK